MKLFRLLVAKIHMHKGRIIGMRRIFSNDGYWRNKFNNIKKSFLLNFIKKRRWSRWFDLFVSYMKKKIRPFIDELDSRVFGLECHNNNHEGRYIHSFSCSILIFLREKKNRLKVIQIQFGSYLWSRKIALSSLFWASFL